MPVVARRQDISVADGKLIVAEAATWKGTPYALTGAKAAKGIGGDCSGTTFKIYQAAQFPYAYMQASAFPASALRNQRFRELATGEARQEGDILSWPNHMAIYSSFASDAANGTIERQNKNGNGTWIQKNDMWTASHPDGPPYAPAELRWWRPDAPRVFRYQK